MVKQRYSPPLNITPPCEQVDESLLHPGEVAWSNSQRSKVRINYLRGDPLHHIPSHLPQFCELSWHHLSSKIAAASLLHQDGESA
jgi:hypothetical protein